MFLTAFDGLILELKKHGLTCLAYADDLAVVSKGRQKLKKAIEICMKWTIENKMIINKKKSGILIHEFRKKGKKKEKSRKRNRLNSDSNRI